MYRRCLLCLAYCNNSLPLCPHCEDELPWFDNTHFQLQSPNVDLSHCLFHYQPPIDQFIQQLKFQSKLVMAHLFGLLLAKHCLLPSHNTILLPMPLHWQRLRQRGFNQALEIAKVYKKHSKIPISKRHVSRQKATLPQATLTAKKRQANVKNAFTIKKPVTQHNIILLDDVITTGNTIKELAKTVKKARPCHLQVMAIAKS